ncbi:MULTISPECIES: TetR/AcrR family transcriptional regulator C-terminal domain-containing protein [Streptomyces]|uniref:TetR/AcrR family transcriptional regulator C-terminal domain-containing protein n=1 Tax=Streptomyces TaxID=1883 RepID=UPI0007CD5621|nr:GntR family transcriptional regulator [Streptomyces noursei]
MADRSPYLRIAADIRQRVTDGDLRPGDRVPSTRQIARQWGVALATATKALTALRLEGVVEALPRVGTVVAGPRTPDAPPATPGAPPATPGSAPLRAPHGPPAPRHTAEPDLTRARIVRAAIEIADAEGLAALSMRGVAARLGVAAMSPYRHVGSKDELVALMADAAYGEVAPPEAAPGHWRSRVEAGARALWEVCRRHPWVAQLGPISRPLVLPHLMAHGEGMLAALEGSGADARTRFDIHLLIYSYVQGLAVNLEREVQAQATTGLTEDEWMEGQEAAMRDLLTSGRHPALTRTLTAFEDGYDLDLDALFHFGLEPLLDGIERLVDRLTRPA